MKKLLAVILTLVIILSLSACLSSTKKDDVSESPTSGEISKDSSEASTESQSSENSSKTPADNITFENSTVKLSAPSGYIFTEENQGAAEIVTSTKDNNVFVLTSLPFDMGEIELSKEMALGGMISAKASIASQGQEIDELSEVEEATIGEAKAYKQSFLLKISDGNMTIEIYVCAAKAKMHSVIVGSTDSGELEVLNTILSSFEWK